MKHCLFTRKAYLDLLFKENCNSIIKASTRIGLGHLGSISYLYGLPPPESLLKLITSILAFIKTNSSIFRVYHLYRRKYSGTKLQTNKRAKKNRN